MSSSNNDAKPSDSTPPEAPAASSPLDSVRSSIQSLIHRSVVATNNALASLEHTTHSIQESPVVSTLKNAEQKTLAVWNQASEHTSYIYTHRREYGPHLITGSALTAGGLAALRRGRWAGGLAGVLGASAMYVVVYEQQVNFARAVDILMGKDKK